MRTRGQSPSPSILWDSLCTRHGGLRHGVTHEAGHAVAAVEYGIEFLDVSLSPDPSLHPTDVRDFRGGGVRFASVELLRAAVVGDPAGSLRFCLAGAFAEEAAFGHALHDSHRSDLNAWRDCAGLRGKQSEESLGARLGTPFLSVIQATRKEIERLGTAITAVARALEDRPGLTLDYREVCQVVAAASHRGRP
ncbi:MAG: hypothetical protein JWO62_5 [Acidimicrobiaceae bacterium]|nr:hypothetical protein [Acidimicrobiaceae bacterium]